MGVYSKSIAEGSFEHKFYEALGFPPVFGDDESLVLRITLGDMELLDGFYISLPVDATNISVEELLAEYVLCEKEEDRATVKQKLAHDSNPDLLDIYNSLLWLFNQAESGNIIFSYHINNGASDISPSDSVSIHQQIHQTSTGNSYNLLDLVLEVYDNLDPFSGMTDDQKEPILRDFNALLILYYMDRFGYQPETKEPESNQYSSALEYLASEDMGLIRFMEEWSITPAGYELLDNVIDEAEFYIDNYDIYGDVYIKGTTVIRFGTEYGENLIVPVFIREGIDPYRALFIAALYLGNLDHLIAALDASLSEETFVELFSLIAHSPDIRADILNRVIHEGKLSIERRQLREKRLKHIESIEQRISDSKQLAAIDPFEIIDPDDDALRQFHNIMIEAFPDPSEREDMEILRTNLREGSWADGDEICRYHIVVMRQGDQVVGGTSFYFYTDGGDALGIGSYLAVKEEFRGQGIGTELIDLRGRILCRDAQELDCYLKGLVIQISDPELMSAAEIENDVMDPWDRENFWRRRGFRKIYFNFIQPSIREGEPAIEYLSLYMLPYCPEWENMGRISNVELKKVIDGFIKCTGTPGPPETDPAYIRMKEGLAKYRHFFVL